MDKIKIIVRKENDIKISFGKENGDIKLDFKDKVIIGGQYQEYEGEYEVTPRTVAQVLPTKEKNMKNDVTVKEIPFYEVGNLQNGKTVYIG